jgi:predicted RNA-binding Zn ribbon-like protein
MNDRKPPQFLWLGNHLALDFLNTQPVLRGQPVELLSDADSLIAWGKQAGLLNRPSAARASLRFRNRREAAAWLARAHRLRAALRAIVDGPGRHAPPGRQPSGRSAPPRRPALRPADLAVLNECLRLPGPTLELARTPKGLVRRARVSDDPAAFVLRAVAEAAANLLCDADPALVRRCGNPECVLFFYDESRNHRRRWCSMELCGNRLKVAAHYLRHRAQK